MPPKKQTAGNMPYSGFCAMNPSQCIDNYSQCNKITVQKGSGKKSKN